MVFSELKNFATILLCTWALGTWHYWEARKGMPTIPFPTYVIRICDLYDLLGIIGMDPIITDIVACIEAADVLCKGQSAPEDHKMVCMQIPNYCRKRW